MTKFQKLVEVKIKELRIYSKNVFNIDVKVNISYNLDSARALGQYSPSTKTIILNPKLLEEYGTVYIEDTVVHEFAHAVVNYKYPRGYRNGSYKRIMPHGKEFKAVCSHFGNDGKATSSTFSDSTSIKKVNKQARFTYKCGCQTHEITKTRHNKILRGAKYTCKTCRTHLKLA